MRTVAFYIFHVRAHSRASKNWSTSKGRIKGKGGAGVGEYRYAGEVKQNRNETGSRRFEGTIKGKRETFFPRWIRLRLVPPGYCANSLNHDAENCSTLWEIIEELWFLHFFFPKFVIFRLGQKYGYCTPIFYTWKSVNVFSMRRESISIWILLKRTAILSNYMCTAKRCIDESGTFRQVADYQPHWHRYRIIIYVSRDSRVHGAALIRRN